MPHWPAYCYNNRGRKGDKKSEEVKGARARESRSTGRGSEGYYKLLFVHFVAAVAAAASSVKFYVRLDRLYEEAPRPLYAYQCKNNAHEESNILINYSTSMNISLTQALVTVKLVILTAD